MKIAVVSNDGEIISAHFGRAQYYVVITVEDGQITGRELREKPVHSHRHGEHHHHEEHGHGTGPGAEERHAGMIEVIRDCDVLVARGMGMGAYENLKQAGIRPILTDIRTVDEAVQAFLDGKLEDRPERLH